MPLKQKLQIKEYNIISKSNILIEANSRLNLIEQKMLLCLASNIEPNDKNFKTYTFPIKKFHNILGLTGATKYTELSKITKNLLSKVIEIRTGEELIQISWLSSAIYNKQKGTIDMRFDPLLKPFLLELNNKFTSYRLGNIIKLKSTYSIRIYELLKQYENITERTICLENLRYYLDAVHIYPNYANFKQRILHPVQKELNENTDITFDFQEIKLGKKVYKIKFIIYSKKKSKESSNYSERDLSSFQISNEFEKRIKEFEHNINQQVPLKTLKEWEKYSNIVLNIFEDIKLRTDIKFPIAYIDNVLNAYLKNNKSDKNKKNPDIYHTNSQKQIDINEVLQNTITQYSSSTGTLANFLVKDTFLINTQKLLPLSEAEKLWIQYEEFIMKKIHENINENKKRKKRY